MTTLRIEDYANAEIEPEFSEARGRIVRLGVPNKNTRNINGLLQKLRDCFEQRVILEDEVRELLAEIARLRAMLPSENTSFDTVESLKTRLARAKLRSASVLALRRQVAGLRQDLRDADANLSRQEKETVMIDRLYRAECEKTRRYERIMRANGLVISPSEKIIPMDYQNLEWEYAAKRFLLKPFDVAVSVIVWFVSLVLAILILVIGYTAWGLYKAFEWLAAASFKATKAIIAAGRKFVYQTIPAWWKRSRIRRRLILIWTPVREFFAEDVPDLMDDVRGWWSSKGFTRGDAWTLALIPLVLLLILCLALSIKPSAQTATNPTAFADELMQAPHSGIIDGNVTAKPNPTAAPVSPTPNPTPYVAPNPTGNQRFSFDRRELSQVKIDEWPWGQSVKVVADFIQWADGHGGFHQIHIDGAHRVFLITSHFDGCNWNMSDGGYFLLDRPVHFQGTAYIQAVSPDGDLTRGIYLTTDANCAPDHLVTYPYGDGSH